MVNIVNDGRDCDDLDGTMETPSVLLIWSGTCKRLPEKDGVEAKGDLKTICQEQWNDGRCPYQGGKSNQSNLSSFDDEELMLLITKISVIAHHTATTVICKDKAVHDVVNSDKNSSSVAMNTSLVVFRDFPDVCIILVLCPYVVVYACMVYTARVTRVKINTWLNSCIIQNFQ